VTGVLVLLGVLVVTGGLACYLRARDGRVRTTARRSDGLPDAVRAALAGDGRVTLVQVSTAFCAPCRHARAVLHHLAGTTAGLAHVELDVTDRPEIAARLGVSRTPTTLAFAGDGTELLRVGGVPRKDSLIDALRPHLP
jgi:thiol-disulfide isomerase/thioredoxin